MALFFADENFALPAVRRLRSLGHDVLTAGEVGMVNKRIPDDVVLAYATRLGRAVLTFNWDDFVLLHDRDPNHAGIIVCEVTTDAGLLAARIDTALALLASLFGCLIEVRV